MFLPAKSHSLPSAYGVRPLLRDCLGYSPFRPHTLSLSATCSPVYSTPAPAPTTTQQGSRVASSRACFDCANLSLVSTSKQKRLSMESVLRRMQDFSVRCVGPCGGSKVGKKSVHVMETMTGKIKEKIPHWIYLIIGTDNAV